MLSEFQFDVFLSYSSKDKAVVRQLAERLRTDGLRVWFDEWAIKSGDGVAAQTEEGLEHSRALVLCMSVNSFGLDWAQLESQTFRFRDTSRTDRSFIPLRLDRSRIRRPLLPYPRINWRPEDRELQYEKLLATLQSPPKTEEKTPQPTKHPKLDVSDEDGVLRSYAPVLRPASPFERRMINLSLRHNVVPPEGSLEATRLQRIMDMDVAFQLKLKALQRRLPHLVHARLKTGSGLQMSKLLRAYFLEYFDRYFKLGPGSFPTSFNVVESFMSFDHENQFFDLRIEKEHLLSVNDYFRWYEKGEIPKDPRILEELMLDGVIYSYDMISDQGSLRISGDSQQVFAGVSFVRHQKELSCLLLAGENPPWPSNEDAISMIMEYSAPNRKGLVPDPRLTTKDRYLDGYPDFGKVIILSRFDLGAGKHDVRYINIDAGTWFQVFTDDFSVLADLPPTRIEACRKLAIEGLARYDDLFAVLSSLIYLPAFFSASPQSVQDLEVVTELHALHDEQRSRETIAKVLESRFPKHRHIRCLPMTSGIDDGPVRKIDPPQMEFKCDGYWKAIAPHAIGEGKNGEQIFGRTWVWRHESWSARSPQSFILQRKIDNPEGPDPGVVYVLRSPGLEPNLYKIGFTRRSAGVRAGELSSATGVPLPFGILADWTVGDCGRIEREVHQRLDAFRINPRREFFYAELRYIIEIVNEVINTISGL